MQHFVMLFVKAKSSFILDKLYFEN